VANILAIFNKFFRIWSVNEFIDKE